MRRIGNIHIGKAQSVIDGLPEYEWPLAIVQTSRWHTAWHFWGSPVALLTDERIIIVKDRLFGPARIDDELALVSVEGISSGAIQQYGTFAIKLRTSFGETYSLYFSDAEHGQAFEQQLRRAVDAASKRELEILA